MGPAGGLAAGVIVVAGGQAPDRFEDQVYTSVVAPDGTLSPWRTVAPLPHPRMHAASFASGSRVWVLGGFVRDRVAKRSTLWSDVLVADVGPDGNITEWRSAGTLPGPRSHGAVTEGGGFVWLSGGLAGDPFADPPFLTEVWRARIDTDGSLRDWTPATPLPVGIATHASFVHDGWLYVAGGIGDKPAMRAQVLRAPIRDGQLGAWQRAGDLPLARGHVHQLPLAGDRIYSLGGAIDFQLRSTTEVHIGTFTR
jgi:hypothetical protein